MVTFMIKFQNVIIDSCVFIDLFRTGNVFNELVRIEQGFNIVNSSVVLFELFISASSTEEKLIIEQLEAMFEIVTPSQSDWQQSSRIINIINNKKKFTEKERLYKLQNDCLIALSAYQADCYVFTKNEKDFKEINKIFKINYLTSI